MLLRYCLRATAVEYRLRAIGSAAVANRPAHFWLKKCAGRSSAAAHPIAAKARSLKIACRDLSHFSCEISPLYLQLQPLTR